MARHKAIKILNITGSQRSDRKALTVRLYCICSPSDTDKQLSHPAEITHKLNSFVWILRAYIFSNKKIAFLITQQAVSCRFILMLRLI